MRRNETLVHLAAIMNKCNELELPCKRAVFHYGTCIEEMADDVINVVNRLLEKPEIRSCRIPLVIDFDKMTEEDFWMDCKIFSKLSPTQSEALRQKFLKLVNMLRALQMKVLQVDAEYAELFFKRMTARLKKSANTFDYELWRVRHPHPTMKQLERQQAQLTTNLLLEDVLAYDEDPAGDEIAEVKLEMVKRGIKYDQELPEDFVADCAKLRRYSYWKGEHMFMIDYQQIYTYLFSHCFEKFTKRQRITIYEYDMQLRMIHEDMVKLEPELGKYLYSSKGLGSLENTKLFAPYLHIKEMLKGKWFKDNRAETKYNDKWAEGFAGALMRSEYGSQIAEEWKDKANQVKGYVIGCLKEAGVFMQDLSNDHIASEAGVMKNKRTFGKYIGKDSQEQPYAEWILKHVNDYC